MGTPRLVITALIATSSCQRVDAPPAAVGATTDAVALASRVDATATGASAPLDAAAAPTAAALTPPLAPGVLGLQIVDLEYGGYQAHGLPAIRGDGAEVLALSVADDGGRGWLTMSALVLDGKTGKVRERIPLVDANETWDAMRADEDAGGSVKADALARRVRAGVAALGARLATGSWRPLVSYPATSFNPDGEPPPFVTIADTTFTLEPRAYRVVERRGPSSRGKATATHRIARVFSPPPPRDPDQHCAGDHATLAAIHVDAATGLRLVEIGFFDPGHNCGASGPVFARF